MIYEFYTGSYALEGEEGILRFRLDTEARTLEKRSAFSGIHHPSYLCPNQNRGLLYAVQEQVTEGMIHCLRIGKQGLTKDTALPSGGADPCHLSMSRKQNTLYVANYTGGSLAAFELKEDGGLKGRKDLRQHEGKGANPLRQECAHVHFSEEHDGLLHVTDLGQDQVFLYREEGGVLKDTGRRLMLSAGYGPRHLAFGPAGLPIIYVLCELAGKIVVFKKEETEYEMIQEADTLPADFAGENISAAVKRSGNLLFASNRGHDSIAVFHIRTDGSLSPAGIFPSGGKTPRDFELFGNFLVAANQDSDSLTVLELDRTEGTLSPTELGARLVRPCCICSI